MNAQWFVLGILLLVFLAGCHRRYLEYRLKKQFLKDNHDHVTTKLDEKIDEFFKFGRKED